MKLRSTIMMAGAGLAFSSMAVAAQAKDAARDAATVDFWNSLAAAADTVATPLGEVEGDAATTQVHHGGRHWRRHWRRRWGPARRIHRRAHRRAYRRGLVLAPRYYRYGVHGARYRARRAGFRYFYDGWWYARPWWLVIDYNAYPRSAYVNYEYPVQYDVDDRYDPDVYERGEFAAGSRCNYWSDRCVENWGFNNPNYYGCLRYHSCD